MSKIMLSHGGGGEEMNELISGLIFRVFDNEILRAGNDSALLNLSGELAFSTDSFVVTPLVFGGGDIGKIAACGTINDLAMVGASAKYLSCALIIEEGLEIAELERVLGSLAAVAREEGVQIVCGDTKVVPKGKCDKLFINTSGIGEIIVQGVQLASLRAGAKILLSGDIGRHGAVVLASREELNLSGDLKSDCKSLKPVLKALVAAGVRPLCMRDATRGGLAAVLNEWAKASGLDLLVLDEHIAVSEEVAGVCELFGFEPYELANEGTFVMAVSPDQAELALEVLRKFDSNANEIGEILEADLSGNLEQGELNFTSKIGAGLNLTDKSSAKKRTGRVILQNAYGSKRFLEAPKGELLPRIC